MKPLSEHKKNYDAYHVTRFTKWVHVIAIPMLMLSILIFFSWIRIDFATHWQIDVAWLFVLGIVIYYIYLSATLGILMAILLGLLSWFADWIAGPSPDLLSISLFLLLFISSNILIFYSHYREKRHASVRKKFHHFSLAPLLLVIDFLDYLGIHKFSK